jgi:WD40 repeat protein
MRKPLGNLFRRKANEHGDFAVSSPSTPENSCMLPSSVWMIVFGYLDRHSQNKLCAASTEVFRAKILLKPKQQWPKGIVRIKKIVLSCAFSPDGQELAVVTSNTKRIRIYNCSRGIDQRLMGHQGQCSDVSYAPSNEFLVSCSRVDGSVRLWRKPPQGYDFSDSHEKRIYVNFRTLQVKIFGTLYVCVSPDNKEIASYGDDGNIYISNVEDGTLLARASWRSRLFIDCYNSVVFSSQRLGTIAHTFNNQTVRIWNYRTQRTTGLEDNDSTRMVDYAAYVTSLQFVKSNVTGSGAKEYLAVGCRVALVKIWDLDDFTCLTEIHLGSGWSSVNELVFSRDGTQMACTGGGSKIRCFTFPEGRCIRRSDDHKQKIQTLSLSPDGSTLASGSSDRTLRLFDLTRL